MKVYYFGKPDGWLLRWAFAIKRRWLWTRFVLVVPTALILLVFLPLSWLLVKAGNLGHSIAFGLGFDSREHWD